MSLSCLSVGSDSDTVAIVLSFLFLVVPFFVFSGDFCVVYIIAYCVCHGFLLQITKCRSYTLSGIWTCSVWVFVWVHPRLIRASHAALSCPHLIWRYTVDRPSGLLNWNGGSTSEYQVRSVRRKHVTQEARHSRENTMRRGYFWSLVCKSYTKKLGSLVWYLAVLW